MISKSVGFSGKIGLKAEMYEKHGFYEKYTVNPFLKNTRKYLF